MKGTGSSSFVGILGWPLEHTLSPVIHNVGFRRVALDWTYLSWPVEPRLLGDAVRGLRALGAMGANVTMPHKESVVEHLDELSGDARRVGAVNTIQRIGDRLVGHNTDVDGFSEFLAGDAGFDARGKRALVLGSGGAARAVVRALDDLEVAEVAVAARDTAKAEALGELAQGASVRVEEWPAAPAAAANADLVVNATPLGAAGEHALPGAELRPGQCVVDLLYVPPSTPLGEAARAAGAQAWGGLGMLVRQAAASFTIWTGQAAPLEAMSAAAIHAINAHSRSSG
ncbi:MAG TPA: shikimate dehydrogenase [Actinomycetota bacterium]|nr:shikimate dehydrogenase [Actinomycetota bacterium]